MTGDPGWRSQLLALLDVARLGSQFPDAVKWRTLLELLGREGPRGRPLEVARSEVSGLPTVRALTKLHRLQFVAREFFKTYRKQPRKEARAFSMAIAALELPPVSHTSVRLMTKGRVNRFVVQHERLELNAVRFSVVIDQRSGGHIVLGKDQLARCSEAFTKTLLRACDDSASVAHRALSQVAGLEVVEVLRGQLGPFVSGLWPAPDDVPIDVRALRTVVKGPASAVLSVQLERLGADVARTSLADPWLGDEPLEKGKQLARERRLFCTPDVEPALKALVAATGRPVLVRSR
ncbi:MAG: hypothetical protein Q8L48_13045 [Archangium sp.]|nr:hypothetical protein [Archangium sp.]